VVGILLFLRFVLELALITAVGAGAWDLAGGGGLGALAATVAAAAVVIVWGMAIAPKARRRWPYPNRLVHESALFLIGGLALVATDQTLLGIVFAMTSAAVAVAVRQLSGGIAP
jgi:membrane protein YdbS with pleckstrin-like domain